ncbi:unnamed protein product [Durusdinium trenchii]|uniref:EF-hand domain-containing protein n=1 Tax=Durusdinium trenchii TaxID=1381693 RepID=A0ABP0K331_9DINO
MARRSASAQLVLSATAPAETVSRRQFVSTVGADFVRAKESDLDETALGCLKKKATKLLNSVYLANFIVVVVFLDAYCTCRDIDSRAHQQPTPQAFRILSDLCLVLYTVELLLHFFLQGFSICRDWMIFLDLVIIVCGYIELFFSFLGDESGVIGISIVRALRLVRIFRLIRLLRKVRTLRELHKLATMMATCAKTLVWSFLLCFLVMTVWSMLMVEMIHPLLTDLELSSCRGQCESAMSSVMNANLLLFKTVIAGDSWGEIAVPVIEQYPATAVIFMGSLLTLVFGVLNLIVAVVVDTFAEFRLNDVQNLAEEMEDEIAQDRKSLARLFARIDLDGSGQLTLDELIEGAQRDSDFQSRLRVMDIDESDLQMLFEMIDADSSGTIEAAEFIGPLSRWAHDSKTAPRFIKYNMLQTMQIQEDLYDMCADCFKHLALQIDKVQVEVKGLTKHIVRKKGSKKPETEHLGLGQTSPPMDSRVSAREHLESPLIPRDIRASFNDDVEQISSYTDGSRQLSHWEAPRGSVYDARAEARLSSLEQLGERVALDEMTTEMENVSFRVPPIPETELHDELEHVMLMRPSRQTEMLSEKSRQSRVMDSHLDLLLESAVVKLETSMKKMERLARSADILVRKWNETPEVTRRARTETGQSGSTSSRRSEVFWALYMDRDHVRERKQKKRHTQGRISGRASRLSKGSGPTSSEFEKEKERQEEPEELQDSCFSMSFASSIIDDPEDHDPPAKHG